MSGNLLRFSLCARQGQASQEGRTTSCLVSDDSPCLFLHPLKRVQHPWTQMVVSSGLGLGSRGAGGDTGHGCATCAGSSSGEGEGGTGTWPQGSLMCAFPFWCGRMAL